jgi:hypothetical protein
MIREVAIRPPVDPSEHQRLAQWVKRVSPAQGGLWIFDGEIWQRIALAVEAVSQPLTGRELSCALRLAICAGCEDRAEGWHCGRVMERDVAACSSCLRLAMRGTCPAGRWWMIAEKSRPASRAAA